ncbi:MAG TPA: hypothetical protein VHG93_25180, partial [Longimicrobium sp.]|nr:hypothetical protein [Longimicrobium sp.]
MRAVGLYKFAALIFGAILGVAALAYLAAPGERRAVAATRAADAVEGEAPPREIAVTPAADPPSGGVCTAPGAPPPLE